MEDQISNFSSDTSKDFTQQSAGGAQAGEPFFTMIVKVSSVQQIRLVFIVNEPNQVQHASKFNFNLFNRVHAQRTPEHFLSLSAICSPQKKVSVNHSAKACFVKCALTRAAANTTAFLPAMAAAASSSAV